MRKPITETVGDRITIQRVTGYKLIQYQPTECQRGVKCNCGEECHGTWTDHEGTITEITNWADGAIEATIACDDGTIARRELRPCLLD